MFGTQDEARRHGARGNPLTLDGMRVITPASLRPLDGLRVSSYVVIGHTAAAHPNFSKLIATLDRHVLKAKERAMTSSITTSTERRARVTHSGRDGLTVAHVRAFLADCEAAGIDDSARVRVEDRLANEGANRSGCIEAFVRETHHDGTPDAEADEGDGR